ncbi:MAG: EAL domain-containing protein [Gammaproteobacteria bacterium]
MDAPANDSALLFSAAFDALEEAVFVVDGQRLLRHANAAARALLGGDGRGRPGEPWRRAAALLGGEELACDETGAPPRGSFALTAPGGTRLEFDVRALDTPGGGHLVTVRYGARDRSALLEHALGSSGCGVWEWDAADDEAFIYEEWRPRFAAEYDVPPQVAGRDLAAFIHGNDLERTRAVLLDHLRGKRDCIELETRVRRRDGSWGELLIKGRAVSRDAAGRVARLIGTYADVSEVKREQHVAAVELERKGGTGELLASEERLNAAIEGSGLGVWEWNLENDRFELIGEAFSDVAGSTGSAMLERLHPLDRDDQADALRAYLCGACANYEHEGRYRLGDNLYHWVMVHGRARERDADGRVLRMVGTVTDISAFKTVQEELEGSQKFLTQIIETVPQAIFWQGRDYRYLGCNQRFAELARMRSPAEVIGRTDSELWWGTEASRFHGEDEPLLDGCSQIVHQEVELRGDGGESGWFDLIKVPMFDSSGHVSGILGAIHDVTGLKRAQESAQRLARFDPLTNLPNRRYFSERLEAALAAAARRRAKGALLFIDMDQFKQINDTLGHSVGDALLQAVAFRLTNVTRQEDTVARLGGDEFVVLLPDIARDFTDCGRQAQRVADKIQASLGEPFQFNEHQLHVTPTIGISLFPEQGKGAEDILREADTAMYSGKAAGRNVTRFFQREMEEAAQQRLALEGDLRRAIAAEQFELYFQPQVDRAGDVAGAEALLRWHHPERGMVPPGEFIPVAEERGLIVEIGHWVLEQAFSRLCRWLDSDRGVDELSINVSSRQFRAEDFVGDVEALLAEYRIPPHRVIFEITEGTVIEDVEAAIEIMSRLRRVGIRFAIDDFGVGYSSLSYLKRLPIDQLKIDRSFIGDIGRDQNDEIICQTIVAMSRQLSLETVAEGVETQAQYQFLNALSCNRYQGYLFLAPSPEDEFLEYHAAREHV